MRLKTVLQRMAGGILAAVMVVGSMQPVTAAESEFPAAFEHQEAILSMVILMVQITLSILVLHREFGFCLTDKKQQTCTIRAVHPFCFRRQAMP